MIHVTQQQVLLQILEIFTYGDKMEEICWVVVTLTLHLIHSYQVVLLRVWILQKSWKLVDTRQFI